jgi:SAM-dependent methyltransferase
VRWRDARRAARDPRMVRRLLDRARVHDAVILDAPCGAGRLLAGLAGRARRLVGLDVSAAMLAEARSAAAAACADPPGSLAGEPARDGDAPRAALVRGDLARLPFRDASFDAVVCCRLLHHLADPEELRAAVRELVRVSRGLVLASFWDAGSLAGWRRPRPGAGRRAQPKAELRAAFAAAGAEVTGFAHGVRFVSQQTFLLAEVRRHP